MGGDAEPEEIERMSRLLRSTYPGLKIAWYSGREKLAEGFDMTVLNYIKLGPYVEALGGLKSATTNQALYRIKDDSQLERLYL